jgi:alkylation response protein AidB-like acyl-CoA dehydrogenase
MSDLSDEQRLFRDSVIEFAHRELDTPGSPEDGGRSFRERWRACARLGLQGLPVPVEYGGQGADAVTTVVALEALGHACTDNGLIFALNAHMWAGQIPIVHFGSESQKQRYLPRLCDGSWIAAFGVTEPEAGSDSFSLTTTATPKGGAYVLRGSKTFITNAPTSSSSSRRPTAVWASPGCARSSSTAGLPASRSGPAVTRWASRPRR